MFRRDDETRVREGAASRASDTLTVAVAARRLDLVGGFGRLVPSLVIGDYFGVPGPDPASLMRWARAIFTEIGASRSCSVRRFDADSSCSK